VRKTLNGSLGILIVILFIFSGPVRPQDAPSSNEQEAIQMEYRKLADPGPEHKLLASLEGTWKQEIRFWMSPGSEPIISAGQTVNRMILGGRFLQCLAEGGEGEMKMESLTIMGHDNRYGEYTLVGLDTWGTYYITASGSLDQESNVITMLGSDADPIMGFDQVYDMVVRFADKDKYIIEVIFKNPEMTGGADEFKMVEIIHTRIK
jgi:hypothetical protein